MTSLQFRTIYCCDLQTKVLLSSHTAKDYRCYQLSKLHSTFQVTKFPLVVFMKSHAFRWLHTSSTLPTTLDASSARRGSTCFSPAHENCQLDPKINDLMMIQVENLGGTFSLEKNGVENLIAIFFMER